jgi:Fur family ferric uptake transcriptional regulator
LTVLGVASSVATGGLWDSPAQEERVSPRSSKQGLEPLDALNEHLARHGLKHTRQRELILEHFLAAKGHMTSEDLYERIRATNPEVGAATVYRALKLFCEAGIATATRFREGVTLYEHQVSHHDHLICLGCQEIVEFECETIEDTQRKIARKYKYRLTNHRHDLYGYCAKCQAEGRDSKP